MGALLLFAGCSSGDYTSPDPAPAPATVSTTSTTATSTAGREVTVRGTVAATFASARVVTLQQAVNGYTQLALSTESEVARSNGARAAFSDITAGMTVEAVGRPSTPGTLLARRVVLLS